MNVRRIHTVGLIRRLHALGPLRRQRVPLPRQVQPNTIRLEYDKAISALALDPAHRLVVESLLPSLRLEIGEHHDAAGDGSKAGKSMERIKKMFYDHTFEPKQAKAVAAKFGERTSKFQAAQLKKQAVAAMGTDALVGEPPEVHARLEDFATENAHLITTIPSKYLDEVASIVMREARAGTRWEDIASEIEDRYKVAKNRARLIARDQVGKLYGSLNQIRQEAMGVDGYLWRGVRDNRERDEHVEREGQFYAWSDPPEDGHPGEPINCRCYAEPDFSSILD